MSAEQRKHLSPYHMQGAKSDFQCAPFPMLSNCALLLVLKVNAKVSNPISNECIFKSLTAQSANSVSPCTVALSFLPDCLIKRSTEDLAAVFRETEACNTFTVCSFKSSQTLTTLDFPHLQRKQRMKQVITSL